MSQANTLCETSRTRDLPLAFLREQTFRGPQWWPRAADGEGALPGPTDAWLYVLLVLNVEVAMLFQVMMLLPV